MDDLPSIPQMGGLAGLITFVVLAAVRAWLKDRREAKERAEQIFMTCVKSAYNTVVNRTTAGEKIESKADAGLIELDKFMRIRLRRVATQEERERALIEFDAMHGEQCPGGTPS